MSDLFVTTRVLITVMTYPHPSKNWRELVCTAGISDSGEWIRLYPIDYRYRPTDQRFRKYQWISVGLRKGGKHNDNRRESHQPDLKSLKILGEPLSTKNNWRERRLIIDPLPVYTRLQLEDLYEKERISLGVVQPTEVLDLKVERANPEWKPEWQAALNQFDLFDGLPKHLEKIPVKFSYLFRCEDSDKPHTAMIEDWELGVLFLKERERRGSEKLAIESVRHNFLEVMCAPTCDTRFFMGTTWPHNSWVVVGVFYPQKVAQMELDV